MSELFANMNYAAPEVSINLLAVLVATAVAMGIGSLWYGPLFGDRWMKLVKLNKKDAEKNWQLPMTVMLLLALVQAFILSHFIVFTAYFYPDLSEIVVGLITGFWVFVGFSLPVVLGNSMFARRPNELIKIEVGNQLVTLLVMGALLGFWR